MNNDLSAISIAIFASSIILSVLGMIIGMIFVVFHVSGIINPYPIILFVIELRWLGSWILACLAPLILFIMGKLIAGKYLGLSVFEEVSFCLLSILLVAAVACDFACLLLKRPKSLKYHGARAKK